MDPPSPSPALLARIPAATFLIGLTLAGLGAAWQSAVPILGAPAAPGQALNILALAVTLIITLLQSARWLRHRAALGREFADPVHICAFAAWPMTLMLLAAWASAWTPQTARIIWLAAALVHVAFAVAVIRTWLLRCFGIRRASPVLFLPVAGLLLAPATGRGFGFTEMEWLMFASGIALWMALMPVVISRMLFHGRLARETTPALCLLIAPPGLGLISYMALPDGSMDLFAHVMIGVTLFFSLLLVSLTPQFMRVSFSLSWWMFAFPGAAAAAAGLVYAANLATPVALIGAGVMLGISSIIATLVAGRTVLALLRGEARAISTGQT